MKQQALLIDAGAQEIRAVEYETVEDLRALLGGPIELALGRRNGDVIYADEYGLEKPQTGFYQLAERDDQPIPGRGVLVGEEVEDDSPAGFHTAPPQTTILELWGLVRFLTKRQAQMWAMTTPHPYAGFLLSSRAFQ